MNAWVLSPMRLSCLPLLQLEITFWLFCSLNHNHVTLCEGLEMTIASQCQVISCVITSWTSFSKIYFLSPVFFHVWCVYTCKYNFVFVMLTCNAFHLLSLAHGYVLYKLGMNSHRDCFPAEIPENGSGVA